MSAEFVAGSGKGLGVLPLLSPPLVTREVFAASIGLPLDVVRRQCDRGYWPCITVGKYSLINVEAIRAQAFERGREFSL